MLPVKNSLLPTVSRFFDDDWTDLFNWTPETMNRSLRSIPPVNITEESDHYILELAAPGMKKEDFNIEVKDNTLYISSQMEREEEKEDRNFTMREFSYRSFQRSFNLNTRVVNDSDIDASYKEGILRLKIAKREEARKKPARTIKIS